MIEFLNVDCMEYMATCPDNAFDLAIVDPPYGLKKSSTNGAGKMKRSALASLDTSWDIRPGPLYFRELRRVSKHQLVWGGNYFPEISPCRCYVVWDKKQFMPTFSQSELCYTSFDQPSKIFCHQPRNGPRVHPTQKPIELYSWLLSKFATPGDRILDTHLGSGSSAIAAHYMGHPFVGTEIDPAYFSAARRRFDQETIQHALPL